MICLPHMIYAMNVRHLRFTLLVTWCLFIFCLFSPGREVKTTPADTPHAAPERLRWWTDARFGMFIHYGPVTLTGEEISWSRANSNPQCPNKGPIPVEVYDSLYKKFNPADFKASRLDKRRQNRRHEVHRAHHETLRWIFAVGLEGRRLQHHGYSVQSGPHRGIGSSRAQGRFANRLVFFADGLARSGFSH